MKNSYLTILTILILFLCSIAYTEPTVWYVHPDSALNSIQAGLDSCADYDIVLVGPGTYVENIIWPNTQGIHLLSELGPEITIIDGDSIGTVIKCSTSVSVNNTIIRGFTVQNGVAPVTFPWGASGGIYIFNGEVTVEGNNIINNESTGIKGAVSGAMILHNNTISYNTRSGVSDCYGIISNNIITHNTQAGIRGGNCTNNYIAYNDIGIYSPCSTYGNVITYNSMGIMGDYECFYTKKDTITYNYNGIRGNGYMDSCVIAYNNDIGVQYYDGDIKFCNIFGNGRLGVFNGNESPPFLPAEYNWWGDATGPYHPDSNPGGLGDTVSDYVDFIPWLENPFGVVEKIIRPIIHNTIGPTIFTGPLLLPEGKKCKVFDITGRTVIPDKIKPGIYFIEIEGVVTQKVIKVR